jgi:hypothetical protein
MDRRRELGRLTRLLHHGEELLQEERVALGGFDHAVATRLVDTTCEVPGEETRVVGVEWLEQERGRVQLAATPCRPGVEQLGPREAQQHERRVAREVGDVLDEREQRRLGPLEVVEDHEQRLRARGVLEGAAGGPERLLARRLRQHGVGVCTRGDEQLVHRPQGVALRPAATDRDRGVDALRELVRQARLADTRRAEKGEESR